MTLSVGVPILLVMIIITVWNDKLNYLSIGIITTWFVLWHSFWFLFLTRLIQSKYVNATCRLGVVCWVLNFVLLYFAVNVW